MLAVGMNREIHLHRLDSLGREAPNIVGRHPVDFVLRSQVAFDPSQDRLAVADSAGDILFWLLDGDGRNPERRLNAPGEPMSATFSSDGEFFVHTSQEGAWAWNLRGPVGGAPLFDLMGVGSTHAAFTPDGQWLATAGRYGIALWPMSHRYSQELRRKEGGIDNLEFSGDGKRLFTQWRDGKVLAWDLSGGAGLEPELLLERSPQWPWGLAVDPNGWFLVAGGTGGVWKIPLDGSEPSEIKDFPRQIRSLDPTGRYLAGNRWVDRRTPNMEVLDLETGTRREYEPPGDGNVRQWFFDSSGKLMVTKGGVVSLWDPETGSTETLFENVTLGFPYPDGRVYVTDDQGRWLVDLESGSREPFAVLGDIGQWMHDRTGSILARGSPYGAVFVWSMAEEKPQLLLGHKGFVAEPIFSPDGKWIVSSGNDNVVRLWPMPDLTRKPLHTLPLKRFLAKLKALTNLRVVPDEDDYTGYTIEVDESAYRGWAEVPEW
jgi:WD40 repeat protein